MAARARSVSRANRIWDASRYVDFETGDDANSGTSPYAPWKRAPGDPLATGGPASYTPAPGAIIQFRGDGVVYRGQITTKSSGSIAAPIIYKGTGWGIGRSIVSGADKYICAAKDCAGDMSVPACVRSAQYLVVTLPGGVIPEVWKPLKINGIYMEWSQYPTPRSYWDWCRLDDWITDPTCSRTKTGSLPRYDCAVSGSIITTAIAGDPGYDIGFRLVGYATAFYSPEHCTYDSGTNTITGTKMLQASNAVGGGYTDDLSGHSSVDDPFVLTNHPRFLCQPNSRAYQYCSIDNGSRLIVRRAVTDPFNDYVEVEISARKFGFDFGTKSDVIYQGFEICDQGGAFADAGACGGVITGSSGTRQDVDDLQIHHIAGIYGSASAVDCKGLVQRCDTYQTWETRGFSAKQTLDSSMTDITFSGFAYSGYLGWAPYIERCKLDGLQHVHGNGATIGHQSDGATLRNVTIGRACRPLTVQDGVGITFDRSVFSGGDFTGGGYPQVFPYFEQSQGGIINWSGAPVTTLTMTSCVMLSTDGNNGIFLSGSTGVTLTGCVIQGLQVNVAPSYASRENNLFVDGTGYSAGAYSGETLDTSKLSAAQAFVNASYDASLMTVLRNGDASADFYVGCPDWSLVSAPVITVQPTLSGSTTVGSTLTCNPGSCSSDKYNTKMYQWFFNGGGIDGAESATYVAGAAGSYTCRVRHHNRVGTATATTAAIVVT